MKTNLIKTFGLSASGEEVAIPGVHDLLGSPCVEMIDEDFRLRLHLTFDAETAPEGEPIPDSFMQPIIMLDLLDIENATSAGVALDTEKVRTLIAGLQELLDEGERMHQQMKDADKQE